MYLRGRRQRVAGVAAVQPRSRGGRNGGSICSIQVRVQNLRHRTASKGRC